MPRSTRAISIPLKNRSGRARHRAIRGEAWGEGTCSNGSPPPCICGPAARPVQIGFADSGQVTLNKESGAQVATSKLHSLGAGLNWMQQDASRQREPGHGWARGNLCTDRRLRSG